MEMEELIQKGQKIINEGNFEKSLHYFLSLNQKYPHNAQILICISYVMMKLENFLKAKDILDQAIKIDSTIAETYFLKAICLQNLNNIDSSIEFFQKSIKLDPGHHIAYLHLGKLQKNLGLLNDAINTYLASLECAVNHEDVYINLSEIYIILKNFELALEYAKKANKINDNNFLSLNNYATCLINFGHHKKAFGLLEKAKKINPNFHGTFFNLGLVCRYMGRYDQAIIYFKKSIEINPKFNEPYLALSVIQLINKDFFNGWKNYEYRWNRAESSKQLDFDNPKWKPELGFKKILIWGEQGIGDQILFSNILSDLVKKFEKIFLVIDLRLKEIYKLSFPSIEVLSNTKEINKEKFDYHLPIGSLGLFFRQDIGQFNPKAPLFKISNANNLRRSSKLRCAISWKSTNKDFGRSKSIKLLEMVEILKLKNIEFYNIQYSDESLEINELLDKEEIIINNINELDTFNDLNGLSNFINSCDFTITVSNTNAHLSAALGKPTYLLLPNEVGKFWYWENEVDGKNIWYPSIKKFKQSESYNWDKPIKELKEFLKQKYNLK